MFFSTLPSMASALFPTSIFFWGWAVKNTIKYAKLNATDVAKGKKASRPDFDLGIVSFMTTALSSSYMLGGGGGGGSSLVTRWSLVGSFAFVSINYGLGLGLYFGVMKKKALAIVPIYFASFTILFAMLAYNVHTLLLEQA